MLATKILCPHCGKHLKTSKPLTAGHRVLCPRCARSFVVPADGAGKHADAVTPAPLPLSPAPGIVTELPRPVPAIASNGAPSQPAAARLGVVWIGLLCGGVLLLMVVTAGLIAYFASHKDSSDPSGPVASTSSGATDASGAPAGDPPRLLTPDPQPEPANSLPPEEQKKVNEAIDKGVEWLKKHQTPDGHWGPRSHVVGLTALPALTLLECGVPADDPRIKKAVASVRKAVPTLGATYELALAILFLDRLGDPEDEKYIQTCALRLVAGQSATGGWTYGCPVLIPSQERDLLTVLEHHRPASGLDLFIAGSGGSAPPGFFLKSSPPAPDKGISGGDSVGSKLLPSESTAPFDNKLINPKVADEQAFKKALTRLPPNLRKLPALEPPAKSHKMPARDGTDNSNTQFAILGLSAAQRHHLPLERALALIVVRFRTSQAPNGRYDYHYVHSPKGVGGSPAMTGAGLLGLAVGVGLAAEYGDKADRGGHFEDPAIEKGFTALGSFVGKPLGAKRARGRTPINLYFLWTVERCGVLFNRREIAGKNWYAWGAELLLDHQNQDGTWANGGYPGSMPVADTCFALLFLKRANLAKELTKKLEFFMEGKKLH